MRVFPSLNSLRGQAFLAAITVLGTASWVYGQDEASSGPAPATMSTQEDHAHMQKQLGIQKLRPGPSGNPQAPNAANVDESKANPYPNLPELLKLDSGEKVSTPEEWWKKRRPEIVAHFEREVVGRIPDNVPKVSWQVRATRDAKVGDIEVEERHVVGVVDHSACPEITVEISLAVVLPKNATSPVPLLILFGRTPFDPPIPGFGGGPNGVNSASSRESQILQGGWGYALLNPGSIQDDSGGARVNRTNGTARPGGLTRGIIGLTNRGQPRTPEQWGALRSWGWGASRALDYLETEPKVDKTKVGIEGVSRYGKAALVTMAFDTRFAMVLVGSAGEGGASLYRRNFGEAVENLTGSGEYHWMAGNFLKYGAEESTFGSKNANDLPVDAHQLIALCAPRLTFISYGIPEKGDALWLDQQGSFMATIAAQPAFRLLGAKDLGRSDDYMKEKMPEVNAGLLEGALAWRQHDGGHTDGPNIPHFVRWANGHFQQKGKNP